MSVMAISGEDFRSAGRSLQALLRQPLSKASGLAFVVGLNMFLSIELSLHHNGIAVVWTANGLLLAALVIERNASTRLLMIVLCATANVIVNVVTGRSAGMNLVFAAANTAEVVSAYYLFHRLSSEPLQLWKLTVLKKFTVAGLLAPVMPAVAAAAFINLTADGNFLSGFVTWYGSDFLGLLIVTPAVVLMSNERANFWATRSPAQTLPLFLLLVVVAVAVFTQNDFSLLFLINSILVMIAYRLGPASTATATIMVAIIALVGTASGLGPANIAPHIPWDVRIVIVQLFVLTSFFTALPLAEAMMEDRRLRDQLSDEVTMRGELAENLRLQKEELVCQQLESEVAHIRLREALDSMPAGVVILDQDHRFVTWNQKYAEVFHETSDLLYAGNSLESVLRKGMSRGIFPTAVGREEEWLADRMKHLKVPGANHEQVFSDGRHFLVNERRLSDGCVISVRSDISDLKRREASTRLLFDDNPLPMFLVCKATRVINSANNAAIERYGYKSHELLQLRFCDIQREELRPLEGETGHIGSHLVNGQAVRHIDRGGHVFDVEVYTTEIEHHGVPSIMVAVIDVTQRNLAEARAAHMARHDPLTGLPNRNMLSEQMTQALARVKRGDQIALLCLDLDNFKAVNDTLGHAAGDELLNIVADRLRRMVRETDTVARLGGDEFAVLLIGAELPRGAARVAERIIAAISRPYFLGSKQVQCGVSIGIALAPDDATEAVDLHRFADLALYTAKEERRGTYRFFQGEMDEKVRHRNMLEADLKQAIEREEFEIHYQPIIAMDVAGPTCAEALVRWRHPTRGMISPIEFIPLAEETGMIVQLGEQVMRRACKDAALWPGDMRVSVNLSTIELSNEDLPATVARILEETGLPGERLIVEVTESTIMKDVEYAVRVLNEIGQLGVEISMDDFGTGYSSLSSLRSFPV
ncbi:MAG: diguanylate cyclase domain-containing protein, partial [Hyphomicrobium sp.]